jgi:hypothetical protein
MIEACNPLSAALFPRMMDRNSLNIFFRAAVARVQYSLKKSIRSESGVCAKDFRKSVIIRDPASPLTNII